MFEHLTDIKEKMVALNRIFSIINKNYQLWMDDIVEIAEQWCDRDLDDEERASIEDIKELKTLVDLFHQKFDN